MSLPQPPCIAGDPDISGIGVRVAIYAQNLFSFIPAVSALWDGEVTPYELEAVAAQSQTIIITAFGILISAMVQAKTLGLSNFQATIVLSLSWMNNTNTFIYFLLYVQHKSQLGPQQIASNVFSWLKHFRSILFRPVVVANSKADVEAQIESSELQSTEQLNAIEATENANRSLFSVIFRVEIKGSVAILGSLHLALMAALGIWLWSNPRSFGKVQNTQDDSLCGILYASTNILGYKIPLGSDALRIISLVLYSSVLVPGLNLTLPIAGFVGIFLLHTSLRPDPRRNSNNKMAGRGGKSPGDHRAMRAQWAARAARRRTRMATEDTSWSAIKRPSPSPQSTNIMGRSLFALQSWYDPFLLPTILGLLLLFAINIIFIIDIELALRQNNYLQESDDSEWTFGQILALLLLVLPLRDLRIFGARRNVTTSLQNALRWHAPTEILWDLVRRGADVNVIVDGPYPTALLLAVARRRDPQFTRILLASGANPDIPDESNCTPLQAACAHGDFIIVKLLLKFHADPNLEGGEYGTALEAAAHSGNIKIVQLLLDAGADIHFEGGKYGSALQAAVARGHSDVVELLQMHGAKSRWEEEEETEVIY
ncbi:hypothetical protein R3P38DRAFT_1621904 [Favolaschia claudopus]|uniref:Uncharacterized protein n=1 Tax=Favolaschia claudopus TaxID=2862362 RepID=A0AAW0AET9_9AGAR